MALPRTEGAGPRPLAAVESTRPLSPLGDTRDENMGRLARLDVGRQFQAQILSRFDDGTFLVRIADAAARLALPNGGKVGDHLALTLLATDPRPAFSLDGQTAGASGSGAPAGTRLAQALYLSNAATQTPGPAAAATAPDQGAAQAALSATGRLVADLVATARDGDTAALVGKIPLAPAPGSAAPQLATALQDTLAFSGLFYESHVGQWANGERALSDLLREPQARGSTATAGPGLAPAPATLPPEVAEAKRLLLDYFGAAPLPAGPDAPAALDPAAARMINLQLDTLEHQRVLWQGELWPGQAMEWQVGRDGAGQKQDRGTASGPAREHWQSVVRFSLPGLGQVSATLHLAGDHVRIQVGAASEETAALLRRNGPRLWSALDAAGTILDNLSIRREASDDGAA